MKKIFLLSILLSLSACGSKLDSSKLDGTYVSDFTKSSYTFKNGTVIESRNGMKLDESPYLIDGDAIKIHGFPFTLFKDGTEDLNGGSAFGRLVKK
ncbi:hypothetical protein FERRO_06170 [Ferrovum sp. JA12]|uniref:hypothetical protein n=1 Tax=Ferrovum sp. JA12 TaxID=1356299 RepID=UPI000702D2E9|nr:hypothetical protein [Ferrovum sp. JA12]KRH79549.1 hypothetical protein FERRO_06170 [Ferrovum sp. JA12]